MPDTPPLATKLHERALRPSSPPRPPTGEQSPIRSRGGMRDYNPSDWDDAVISLGKGVRLYSESHYLREFHKFGFTRRGFRSLLRRLCVPLIEFPNGRYFINPDTFRLAILAISRLGRSNFIAVPGVSWKIKDKHPGPYSTELEQGYVEDHFNELVAEMIAARVRPGKRPTKAMWAAANEAVEHFQIASANLYAIRQKNANVRRALHLCDEKGVIFDATQRAAESRPDPRPTL